MFRKMLVLIGLLAIVGESRAVQVDGYAFLTGQTNHAGIKVLFEAASPSAVTDSTYTDSTGYYLLDVAGGIYDVYYSYTGYAEELVPGQILFSPQTLTDIWLYLELIGQLSGLLEPGEYHITGSIEVAAGDTLILEAGVSFIFSGHYGFTINGVLLAEGTEEDSIRFLPDEGVDYWQGLNFLGSASDSSRLSFCLITGSDDSGINFDNSSPIIAHCNVSGNSVEYFGIGGGIYCYNSSPSISNCVISGNSGGFGGGIYCYNSNPSITYCTIIGNSATCDGGGIYCYYNANPSITNCIISDNSTEISGGGGIYCYYNANPSITHSTISDNSTYFGGGIYCSFSNPSIANCTISDNSGYFGGGIYCDASNPDIVNTIVEGNTGGGGIYFDASSSGAQITYGDFHNNIGGNFTGPSIPAWLGQIVTVNVNGDSCDAFFNIFEDPLFIDPSGGDFHLQAGSPCIDAGDPESPLDPDSTIADIGAFYFDQGSAPTQPQIALSSYLLSFGQVVVGEQGNLDLTINNIGDTTLVLYDLTTSDPDVFTTDWNTADSLISAGDSLIVTVTFSPLELVSYDETLTVFNNDTTATVVLRGTGVNAVSVNLTPYNPPIVIPETGGSFDFNILARNLTQEPQTFDLWTQIELPGTGTIEPLSVTDLTLAGNTSADRDRSQTVPAYAPAGTYIYHAYVGDYPWVIENSDSFTFEKLGSDRGGSLGSPAGWICSGESFEEYLAAEHPDLPTKFAVTGVYPNPFNPATVIRFDLPQAAKVRLDVYDVNGRNVGAQHVAPLQDTRYLSGSHEITFDGSGLPSGVYLYRLTAGDLTATGKMVLLK